MMTASTLTDQRQKAARVAWSVGVWLAPFLLSKETSECSRHSDGRASSIPGFLIELDSQAVHQLVEATEQINHRHQFEHGLVIQA